MCLQIFLVPLKNIPDLVQVIYVSANIFGAPEKYSRPCTGDICVQKYLKNHYKNILDLQKKYICPEKSPKRKKLIPFPSQKSPHTNLTS